MKHLLRLEEIGQFLLGIFLFSQLEYAWWVFPACILLPDLSMIGYLVNPKVGAYLYNLFHHKLLSISAIIAGYFAGSDILLLAGIILFSHAAMDRNFGYGLKYTTGFKHTHMGVIGNKVENIQD